MLTWLGFRLKDMYEWVRGASEFEIIILAMYLQPNLLFIEESILTEMKLHCHTICDI